MSVYSAEREYNGLARSLCKTQCISDAGKGIEERQKTKGWMEVLSSEGK